MFDFKLLLDLNTYHQKSVTNTVIENLIRLDDPIMLSSGDDSGLKNVWEEVCVQVQQEQSFAWDAYDITIDNFISDELQNLPKAVCDLICYIGSFDDEDAATDNENEERDFSLEHGMKAVKDSVMEAAGAYESESMNAYLYPDDEEEEELEDEDVNDDD